jgi:hypothetical protein
MIVIWTGRPIRPLAMISPIAGTNRKDWHLGFPSKPPGVNAQAIGLGLIDHIDNKAHGQAHALKAQGQGKVVAKIARLSNTENPQIPTCSRGLQEKGEGYPLILGRGDR